MGRTPRFALLLLATLPAVACAQYVDTTARKSYDHQIALYSVLLFPRNPIWHGDSLSCEASAIGAPSWGGEFMLRYKPNLLLGVHVATTRVYTDAIHWRSTTYHSNTEWTAHGDRVGMDQRFTTVDLVAAYEPWHYPRRRKVGMTLQLSAALGYMHFSEQRYYLTNSEAEASNLYGRTFYTYEDHEDAQQMGRTDGHGMSLQGWLRPELHFGRRVSLFWDLGVVFATPFDADGDTYTPPQGTTLSIVPHRVQLARAMIRGGLAVYW